MVKRYIANIAEFQLDQGLVTAVVGNLLSHPPEPSFLSNEEYHGFNLITVGAALHHFPSAEDAVKILAARLKPGGVLYIQDLFTSEKEQGVDGAMIPVSKTPPGFTEGEIKRILETSGLVDFNFEVLHGDLMIEMPNEEILKIRCFLARAMKPEAEASEVF